MDMHEFSFDFWEQMAKGIAGHFGVDCEVSVHDLTGDVESTIIAIENGHVTGRRVGEGPSKIVLEALNKNNHSVLNDRISYLTQTDDGRTLKSTTLYIKNSSGEVVYIFAINYDITNLIMMNLTLSGLLDVAENQQAPEKISKNVNDLLDELLKQSIQIVGKPVPSMTREDKIKAINFLNDAGAFLITKSGDKISKYFGISKFTLYNYLDVD